MEDLASALQSLLQIPALILIPALYVTLPFVLIYGVAWLIKKALEEWRMRFS